MRFGELEGGHRGNEAVATAMRRGNKLRCPRRVTQRLANLGDAHLQHRITDGRTRPDGGEQLLFGHEPTGMSHQMVQHSESFGLQCDGLRAVPETGVLRI
jgi:hypothetical protein